MRVTTILALTFLTSRLFGQQLDSLGLGDENVLTRQEYTFLNADFNDRGDFDFKGKKLAYVGGTTGNFIWTKKEFFDSFVRPRIGTRNKKNYSLTILTPTEKKKSGGYDAFILTPVKVFTDQHRKKLLTELSKK